MVTRSMDFCRPDKTGNGANSPFWIQNQLFVIGIHTDPNRTAGPPAKHILPSVGSFTVLYRKFAQDTDPSAFACLDRTRFSLSSIESF